MKYLSKRFIGKYRIIGLILLILLILFGSTPAITSIMMGMSRDIVFIITVGYALFTLIFYLIFYRRHQNKMGVLNTLKVLVVGFVSILTLSYLLGLIFGSNASISQNQEAIENMLALNFSPALIAYMVLLAPAVEEYTFREYLPGIIRKIFKKTDQNLRDIISLILANIVFALMHIPTDLYSFLVYFSLGFVLVMVRYLTNSLRLSAYLHSLWNLTSVVILYFAL